MQRLRYLSTQCIDFIAKHFCRLCFLLFCRPASTSFGVWLSGFHKWVAHFSSFSRVNLSRFPLFFISPFFYSPNVFCLHYNMSYLLSHIGHALSILWYLLRFIAIKEEMHVVELGFNKNILSSFRVCEPIYHAANKCEFLHLFLFCVTLLFSVWPFHFCFLVFFSTSSGRNLKTLN